jgi:hypothetical protein
VATININCWIRIGLNKPSMMEKNQRRADVMLKEMRQVSQARRRGNLQEPAGITHHGAPKAKEIIGKLLTEGVILFPIPGQQSS